MPLERVSHLLKAFKPLPKKYDYKTPKLPIILCHGIIDLQGLFGFATLGHPKLPFLQLRYWRGVQDALQQNGCEVSCTSVGSVSSLKSRAEQLHLFLSTHYKGRQVNLIGHSMGGLDARYVIAHIPNRNYTIKSLTTVATPHRGSSFMDWCRDTIGVGHMGRYAERVADDAIITRLESLYHENLIFHSKQFLLPKVVKPLDAPAFSNLTRDYCREFNKFTIDDPNVYYSSYAAKTVLKPYQALAFSQKIVSKVEGENDGLVSVDSAKWGDFVGVVDCDHWDLVPSKVRVLVDGIMKRPFDHVDFYLSIANRLAQRGY